MVENDQLPEDYYKCLKVPLQHVLKNQGATLPKINEVVMKMNKMVIHGLQFIKLYHLHQLEANEPLPTLDDKFVREVLKTVCLRGSGSGRVKEETTALRNRLVGFYDTHYRPLRKDEPTDFKNLDQVMTYMVTDILTMFKNNITIHYVDYVERFVNVFWDKKQRIDEIHGREDLTAAQKDAHVKELVKELRQVKTDILTVGTRPADDTEFVRHCKRRFVPAKSKFKKDSLVYDLKCDPMAYFEGMIRMMQFVEGDGCSVSNVFPLRNDCTPKHVCFDTKTLIQLLLDKEQLGTRTKKQWIETYKQCESELWGFLFRTDLPCFRKAHYRFDHQIMTDGVSVSLMFLRNDWCDEKAKRTRFSPPKPSDTAKERYVSDLTKQEAGALVGKNVVAIDPGKCDLIFCVDGPGKDANQFRYSQDQRRKETKSKKYNRIMKDVKRHHEAPITALETELSLFNRKALTVAGFRDYVRKKNDVNETLLAFYQNRLFRKLKLNGYLNRLRSEQRMLRQFEKKFGSPGSTVVCFGDFEQKQHMKFKEPIKGKGMRTLIRKAGYRTLLVDEFRTSCMCSKCEGGRCEKFMKRKNPRPWQSGISLVHGLLRCKTCDCLWNRDSNGATNIHKIAWNAIHRVARPGYLCRSK